MAQVTQIRCRHRRPRHFPHYQPSLAWPRRPVDLRAAADDMLREMAFVFQATRTVREAMAQSALGAAALAG